MAKEVLYPKKDATEQLRMIYGVSITEMSSQKLDDVFVVTAKAQNAHGRTDASTGAVSIGHLKGEALANALMKSFCFGESDELRLLNRPTVPRGALENRAGEPGCSSLGRGQIHGHEKQCTAAGLRSANFQTNAVWAVAIAAQTTSTAAAQTQTAVCTGVPIGPCRAARSGSTPAPRDTAPARRS
jgi:hypothetical protein